MKKQLIATATGIAILVGGSVATLDLSKVKASVIEIIKPNKTENQIDMELGVQKELKTEDYKALLDEFDKSVSQDYADKFEKKLAQRSFIEMKQSGKNIDKKALKEEIKEQAKFEKAWIKYSKDEYDINVTPKEIDEWINNGPDKFPVDTQKDFAEALEVSLKELNHSYYRDQYEKWVIWEKLRPLVAEKYGIKEADYDNVQVQEDTPVEEMNFNNKVLNLYEKEVTSSMK